MVGPHIQRRATRRISNRYYGPETKEISYLFTVLRRSPRIILFLHAHTLGISTFRAIVFHEILELFVTSRLLLVS